MSASQLSTPAHWASWADAMPVLQRQLPSVAATILQALNNLDEAQPCIQAAQAAHQHIHAHGWEPPRWQQVLGQQPPQTQAEAFTGPTQPGWQHHAPAPFHRTARAGVYNSIDAASQAQRGGTYWLLVCGRGRSTYYFVRLYRRRPHHQWIGLCCCCCFVLSPSVHVRPPLCQHAWTVRIGGGHRLRGTGWQKLGRCNVR